MSRAKKLNILIPLVFTLFIGAYARHRYIANEIVLAGKLQDKELDEISGISASTISPDVFYVHNDSGDTSRFFSITPDGKLLSTINYNVVNFQKYTLDCEDIAVGPGPDPKKSYVYIGDIGDNAGRRPSIDIYRVPEQAAWAKEGRTNAVSNVLHLTYPDGPKDAETLMVDPLQKLLCIVSKRQDTVALYTTPLNFKNNDTVVLTRRSKLFFKGFSFGKFNMAKWITAGDISKDGHRILLKSYEKVYYWPRNNNEPVWEAMARKPIEPAYQQEKQGEAIGFTRDGKGYYTTSEGVFAPIYYYTTP